MGFLKNFFANTRKPRGFLGKIMLTGMNRGHAECGDWGMEHIDNLSPDAILDCGCGGGRNIKVLLARYPKAVVHGLDYSSAAVDKTRQINHKAIEEGRCYVVQGDVSVIPFEDNKFDLVTAFETVYFWPDLESCFRQVFRVLKEGGLFLIMNESDGTDAVGMKWEKLIDGMSLYKGEELADILKKAGFIDIKVSQHMQKPWLVVTGRHP